MVLPFAEAAAAGRQYNPWIARCNRHQQTSRAQWNRRHEEREFCANCFVHTAEIVEHDVGDCQLLDSAFSSRIDIFCWNLFQMVYSNGVLASRGLPRAAPVVARPANGCRYTPALHARAEAGASLPVLRLAERPLSAEEVYEVPRGMRC